METGHFFWGAAIISILVVSWFFYRYVVPHSWREWARAGIVQAFIISFYAEMYGFPVTIYLVARFFGWDATGIFWEGNLWTNIFGTRLAMMVAMAIGYTIAGFGILVVIAGWREVYRARKEERLATGGPYAYVRHPQYTGIIMAFFGEGVVHWPTVLSLAAFPIIVIAYVLLARKEERELTERFGEHYLAYKRRVPMFFPHAHDWRRLFGISQPAQEHQ